MMVYMGTQIIDIESMPRGGPDALWLDRRLQTRRLESPDCDDVDHLKRAVVRSLDRFGRFFGHHERFPRLALDEVADVPNPKILEPGSGHGGLSRALLKMHPTAGVTVTDVEPTSVAAIAAGDLGDHPRATVCQMDATHIDAPDGYSTPQCSRCRYIICRPHWRHRCSPRTPGPRQAADHRPAPAAGIHCTSHGWWRRCHWPRSWRSHTTGSSARCAPTSPSALEALARHADPAIEVELGSGGVFNSPLPHARRSSWQHGAGQLRKRH